jgi:hypothetical protein
MNEIRRGCESEAWKGVNIVVNLCWLRTVLEIENMRFFFQSKAQNVKDLQCDKPPISMCASSFHPSPAAVFFKL